MNIQDYYIPEFIEQQEKALERNKALIADMVEGKMTYQEMADKYNTCKSYISYMFKTYFPGWLELQKELKLNKRAVRKNNKRMKDDLKKIRDRRIKELHEKGLTVREISKETGWSVGTVHKYIRV